MRILHTSDWHLGIRHGAVSRGPDHDLFLEWLQVVRAQFCERCGAAYTHLADLARERFPGVPIVATGPLTLGTDRDN